MLSATAGGALQCNRDTVAPQQRRLPKVSVGLGLPQLPPINAARPATTSAASEPVGDEAAPARPHGNAFSVRLRAAAGDRQLRSQRAALLQHSCQLFPSPAASATTSRHCSTARTSAAMSTVSPSLGAFCAARTDGVSAAEPRCICRDGCFGTACPSNDECFGGGSSTSHPGYTVQMRRRRLSVRRPALRGGQRRPPAGAAHPGLCPTLPPATVSTTTRPHSGPSSVSWAASVPPACIWYRNQWH